MRPQWWDATDECIAVASLTLAGADFCAMLRTLSEIRMLPEVP